MEILELKFSVTKMKITLEGFNSRFAEEWVNLKTGHWNLSSEQKKEKKNEKERRQLKGFMGHYQEDS